MDYRVGSDFYNPSEYPPTKESSSSASAQPPLIEIWVTVSPKKRVRPVMGPRPRKTSILKPQDISGLATATSNPLHVAAQTAATNLNGAAVPLDPTEITLMP